MPPAGELDEGTPLREKVIKRTKNQPAVPIHYRSTWSSPPQFFHENSYNIFWDLTTLILTFSEIALVLYLSIHHFINAEKELEGMAMLLPIALNFIGVIYFLSNPEERTQFETIGCTRCCTDILQFPIFGPVLTEFMILLISIGWSYNMENYRRLEASAAKMRQATTFFSAAPEALVQLTVLLVSKTDNLSVDKYIEIAVVIVAVIAIAEANTFSLISNYFRIFHKYAPGDWDLPHNAKFWQKFLLFTHALTSAGSNLLAKAFLKAGLFYYFKTDNFAIALVVSLLLEMAYRTLLYYIARLLKNIIALHGRDIPSGCYESMQYAWRETILSFGFQSQNILVQTWFYLENIGFFIFWIIALESQAELFEDDVGWAKEMIFLPASILFCILIGLSFFMLLIIHCSKLFVIHGPFYERK